MAEPNIAPAAAEPAATAEPEAPAKPETLRDQWDRISEKTEGDEPDKTEPAEAGEAKPDEKKPPKKVEKPGKEPPATNELEVLQQTARRLGFVIEDGRVTTRERAEFRNARREEAERRAAAEQDFVSRLDRIKSEAMPQIEKATAFSTALEAGDHDGMAKACGFENWDKLVEDQIARKADPNYVRLRKLEQAQLERAEQDERAAREAQQQHEHRQRAQAQVQYKQELASTMKSSKDPLVAAFAEDPAFVGAIFAIQMAHYQATGEHLAADRAVRMKAPGATVTPREWIEAVYKRAQPVFTVPAAPAAEETAAAAAAARPAPRTPSIPKPSPSKVAKFATDRAQKNDMIRRFESAVESDRSHFRKTGVMP